jgi:CxxC-x17-CxxC domain-containing protein
VKITCPMWYTKNVLYSVLLLRVDCLLEAARYGEFLRDRSQNREEQMSLTDRTLYCRDCNQAFTFTVGEQEFYASRGLTNDPSRCPDCRAARKQASGGQRNSYGRSSGGYRERDARPMYSAICANCGNETQVPFQPREDRPVYCSDCYQSQRTDRSHDRRSRW